ncbi:hypothetical protein BS47DRAFT_1398290 [Hydnum rufescens UP504]|uniref:Uncharacterized protein n=1 Tax=Hydnum rufescens UP504 TaxID=1448309 RepID=A0A9P6DMD2_9AGAM|nr:hypothetical protein BS47DRAFT_1398290 [Hydnum rufescens UP504]
MANLGDHRVLLIKIDSGHSSFESNSHRWLSPGDTRKRYGFSPPPFVLSYIIPLCFAFLQRPPSTLVLIATHIALAAALFKIPAKWKCMECLPVFVLPVKSKPRFFSLCSEYTSNVVRPAYLKLIESFGGEDSDTWAAEATRLIAEHDGKEKWTHDMQWLVTMDVHAMFIMVSSNTASPAAHAQNECRLGSIEMSEWFNAKFSMAAKISDIYRFILSKHSQHEALREFTAEESQKKRAFDLSNVYKTRTAIKGMLAALFRPYVEFSVFPWMNLAKILIEHKLILRNFLPNAQFPNFGSEYSDHYGMSHWKALYFALQDTNPERKVTLSSLDDWPEGDASDIPLIVDHNGDVILSLKGLGMLPPRRSKEGDQEAKGKWKSTPLSSAYINSESDNAVESDPSGPSEVHLGNELQPQPKPRPRFSNSQASPSVSGVTSAPPPPLIDLPRMDWRGVDLSYFDPASFDNTFNAYPGSMNGTMDRNADMIPLCQTSTLQHGDYPGTAQPDDLFGFQWGTNKDMRRLACMILEVPVPCRMVSTMRMGLHIILWMLPGDLTALDYLHHFNSVDLVSCSSRVDALMHL